VVVVATASLTWGAGAAFATDDPPIDQSNTVNVDQQGGGSCIPTYAEEPPWDECEEGEAVGNSGGNAQYSEHQVNATGQVAVSVADVDYHHHSDAFAIGLLFAIAVGGDALAGASNSAVSGNDLDLTNDLTTGNAAGVNALEVIGGEQTNTNSGDVVTVGLGGGVSAIHQTNWASIYADNNTAVANSGANGQGSGGQLNLTGQLALAGAQGSPALALTFGLGVAVGGDATASAANSSGGSEDSNSQSVTNIMTTGNALAGNSVEVGSEETFAQSNTNSGNAYIAEGLACIAFAGAFIGQHNDLIVGPSGNTAIANSGANEQGSGSQLNGTLQIAGAGASGGWAAAPGLIALAFAGDATAGALNESNSSNFQDVSSTLTTGNATAQNFTSVDASQSNVNEGNAGALEALAFVGVGVGAIVQTNVAYVTSLGNDAVANTGANGQVAGFQGNGTIQGAGAGAGGGWAGTLGGLAIAVAGDASAAAVNGATSANESTVVNDMTTGDADASNIQNIELTQTNENTGWAAGIALLDFVAIGAGGIVQYNGLYADASYNESLANSGANYQGALGQGNLTLQGALAGSEGSGAISLGVLAGAVGGDASASASNNASSSNTQDVTNGLETGSATARNLSVINLTQSNTNNGDGPHDGDAVGIAALSGIGIGVALIYQGNSAVVFHDANSAAANTGDNVQFSGPQINITGQLALAGAEGGGALALALLKAGAVGGDAEAGAANTATSSSWQLVSNDLLAGVALAVNGIGVTASQANINTGDAAALVLTAGPALAASAIVQENHLSVTQEGNSAVANSGLNSQSVGGQLNATVQIAADESEAGASSAGAIFGAVAFDGDPTAATVNDATSQNTTEAFNTMETGNATAMNQIQVDVTQENDNEGDVLDVGL
jgi:hypothetical protein